MGGGGGGGIQVSECGEFGTYVENDNSATFRLQGKEQSNEGGPYKLANVENLANLGKLTILPHLPTKQSTKQ